MMGINLGNFVGPCALAMSGALSGWLIQWLVDGSILIPISFGITGFLGGSIFAGKN